MSDLGGIFRDSVYARMATASPSLGLTSLNKARVFNVNATTLATGNHAGVFAGEQETETASRTQSQETLKAVVRVYSRIDLTDLDEGDAFANKVSEIKQLFVGANAGIDLGSLRATINTATQSSEYVPEWERSNLAVMDIVLTAELVKE